MCWAVRPAACPAETADSRPWEHLFFHHNTSPVTATRHNTPQHDSAAWTQLSGLGWQRANCTLLAMIKIKNNYIGGTVSNAKANGLWQHALCYAHGSPCAESGLGREMLDTCSTLLVHCLTVLMSSWMTRSIHLRQGVFSLTICFFTMASNARSGVNSPVLRMHRDRGTDAGKWNS